MAIFIGHSTALFCLRGINRKEQFSISHALPKHGEKPDAKSILQAQTLIRELFGAPAVPQQHIDLVVADAASRGRSKQAANHIWQLPERSNCFLRLGSGVFLSTPEFAFIQAAKDCTFIELAKLGFELCGTYRIDQAASIGFRNAGPLTSANGIAKMLEKIPGRTPKSAERVLTLIRDGSASPMETCLALILGLPTRYGGYGLGMPEMNAKVSIPAKHSKRITHDAYHCDLYWPECRVSVEYNSREFHMSEQAIERDTSRINDLKVAGIEAIAITRAHVADPEKLDAIAHALAKLMGKRMRTNYADIKTRRKALRKQLFSKDRWL